jgi:hypothetical protein
MMLSGDGTSGLPSRLGITNAFCFLPAFFAGIGIMQLHPRNHCAACISTASMGWIVIHLPGSLCNALTSWMLPTNPQLRHWQAAWLLCVSEVAERQAQQSRSWGLPRGLECKQTQYGPTIYACGIKLHEHGHHINHASCLFYGMLGMANQYGHWHYQRIVYETGIAGSLC